MFLFLGKKIKRRFPLKQTLVRRVHHHVQAPRPGLHHRDRRRDVRLERDDELLRRPGQPPPLLNARERAVENRQLEAAVRSDAPRALVAPGLVPRFPLRTPPFDLVAVDAQAVVGFQPLIDEEIPLGETEDVHAQPPRTLADAAHQRHADAPRPTGGAAVLPEEGTETIGLLAEHLGGERAVADPRGHQLEHPNVQDVLELPDADGRPGGAGGRARAVAQHVEVSSLRTFEKDVSTLLLVLVEPPVDAVDLGHGLEPLAPREELFEDLGAEHVLGAANPEVRAELAPGLREPLARQAVPDRDAPLPCDRLVRGCDAATRGADITAVGVDDAFEFDVPRTGDGGVGVDDQVFGVDDDPLALELLDLLAQPARHPLPPRVRKDDAVRADEADTAVEHGTRDQVGDELLPTDDHGVSGVAPTLEADSHRGDVVLDEELADVAEDGGFAAVPPLHVGDGHDDADLAVETALGGTVEGVDEVEKGRRDSRHELHSYAFLPYHADSKRQTKTAL